LFGRASYPKAGTHFREALNPAAGSAWTRRKTSRRRLGPLALALRCGFSGPTSPDFYAVYNGDDLGSPSKGVVAAIATSAGTLGGGANSRQRVRRRLFRFGETLSPGRAASLSIASINSCFTSSQRDAPRRPRDDRLAFGGCWFSGRRRRYHFTPEAAVVFVSRKGELMPLVAEIVRNGENNGPLRLVGADASLHIDHFRARGRSRRPFRPD